MQSVLMVTPNLRVISDTFVLFLTIDEKVLSIASLVREDHQIASVFNIPLQILDLSGSEGIFGSSEDEKVSFFDLLEIDSVLVESNLSLNNPYFVTFLVLFDKLFKVRARVANFLLAGVEYDLSGGCSTTFWADMFEFVFKINQILCNSNQIIR